MKGFLEKYRNISVWLSLFILAMWFVGASDHENRMLCMLLAFLAGAASFGIEAVQEWMADNWILCLICAIVTGFMWAAVLLTGLSMGGVL